jgi:uncharacterized protein
LGAHLLDVNVLIALLEPAHVHYDIAHNWFEDTGNTAWATCPITQNGFIRIVSQRSYGYPMETSMAIDVLRRFTAQRGHIFWPDSVSLVDERFTISNRINSPRQVTDTYLLALAKANDGYLVTLDARLIATAVPGGTDHLITI